MGPKREDDLRCHLTRMVTSGVFSQLREHQRGGAHTTRRGYYARQERSLRNIVHVSVEKDYASLGRSTDEVMIVDASSRNTAYQSRCRERELPGYEGSSVGKKDLSCPSLYVSAVPTHRSLMLVMRLSIGAHGSSCYELARVFVQFSAFPIDIKFPMLLPPARVCGRAGCTQNLDLLRA